jgi:hypothetical protein
MNKDEVITAATLNHCDVWTGRYRGIFLKINKATNWCYYITWNKRRMDNSIFNQLTAGITENNYFSCNYLDSPLATLRWHGGASFGKLFRDENAELQAIEIGCDYNHIWDEGEYYCLDSVLENAKSTIDDFINNYPDWQAK